MTLGVSLDPVPLLLHGVGAAALALVGVGAARWLGAVRGFRPAHVDRWLVAAASWPGGWTYAAPVVVAVLVVVRRRAAAVRA